MLVLSRKASERILIGDDISIEIRRVAGNRVTVAVEAPRDVRILRGELEQAAKEFEDSASPGSNEPEESEEAGGERYAINHAPLDDTSDHGLESYAVG